MTSRAECARLVTSRAECARLVTSRAECARLVTSRAECARLVTSRAECARLVNPRAECARLVNPRAECALALWCCTLASACAHGGPDAWPQRPSYLGDARVVASNGPAFSPVASEHANAPTSGEAALRTTGAEEQARTTALRFARALLEGDAATLSELLPSRVSLTLDGSQKPRDELIERCLKDTHALVYATEHDPAAVLDLTVMRVERADVHHDPPPLPIGIDPADITVTLPLRDADDDSQRRIPCMTTLYVRTGHRAFVVGIAK